jgi:hypothetical protein
LARELELYRTRIFTIVNNEKTASSYSGLQDLPDINITFHTGSQLQYLSNSTTTSQTLYIIHQLVNNNNELIDKCSFYEAENIKISNSFKEKDEEIFYLIKELEKRELQNSRMKGLIQQASSTIMVTEQDYQVLQKQVEILTKKLQLLMMENQKLSSYYHIDYSNNTGGNNSALNATSGNQLYLTNSPAKSQLTFLPPPSMKNDTSNTGGNNNNRVSFSPSAGRFTSSTTSTLLSSASKSSLRTTSTASSPSSYRKL